MGLSAPIANHISGAICLKFVLRLGSWVVTGCAATMASRGPLAVGMEEISGMRQPDHTALFVES